MEIKMKSDYKRLGDYIQQVDARNHDLKVSRLLGLSIEKCFIESIANTIGTDFRPYKIVRKGQFAYGPVTSRNGEKITIALLEEPECIISSSYSVFEIKDTKKLLPEYLMLWFSRSEFDRYARYKSHGSVREIFDWEEMCRVELPVPSITEQQKIVDNYNAINKQIEIISKEDEQIRLLAKLIIQNFMANNTSDTTITINNYCQKLGSGTTPNRSNISFWNEKYFPWIKNGEVKNNILLDAEEYISKRALEECNLKIIRKNSILMAMYCVSKPQLAIVDRDVSINQAICSLICDSYEKTTFLYFYLMFYGQSLINKANGSAQVNLSKEQIAEYQIPFFENSKINMIGVKLGKILEMRRNIAKQIKQLDKAKLLIISHIG